MDVLQCLHQWDILQEKQLKDPSISLDQQMINFNKCQPLPLRSLQSLLQVQSLSVQLLVGLKPEDPIVYKNMQTRELQNGRLAMIGVAGMCAQELVNHRSIFETLDFYSKVYGGENPYAACGDSIIC